jgi:glycosyltransferase involved in cell wall biosynthesis
MRRRALSAEARAEVAAWLDEQAPACVVLHGPDVERRRGYSLNVGLDYASAHADRYDFVGFLDDDEILYPLYAGRLAALLDSTGCDVAVCRASSRVPWDAPCWLTGSSRRASSSRETSIQSIASSCAATGSPARISACLRTSIIWKTGIFSSGLLGAGARFAILPDILCEFRIITDGNQQTKREAVHFKYCLAQIRGRGRIVATKLGVARHLSDVAAFNVAGREPLSDDEIGHLSDACDFYQPELRDADGA